MAARVLRRQQRDEGGLDSRRPSGGGRRPFGPKVSPGGAFRNRTDPKTAVHLRRILQIPPRGRNPLPPLPREALQAAVVYDRTQGDARHEKKHRPEPRHPNLCPRPRHGNGGRQRALRVPRRHAPGRFLQEYHRNYGLKSRGAHREDHHNPHPGQIFPRPPFPRHPGGEHPRQLFGFHFPAQAQL